MIDSILLAELRVEAFNFYSYDLYEPLYFCLKPIEKYKSYKERRDRCYYRENLGGNEYEKKIMFYHCFGNIICVFYDCQIRKCMDK